MNILVLNAGSSSLKFQVISTDLERIQRDGDERLCKGYVDRRAALWQVLAIGEELPLFAGLNDESAAPRLPELEIGQHVIADYQATGLSLKAHPISLIRGDLER